MIVLTMNGLYKETNTNNNATRSFHRTFVIVPNAGGGFCIINDMLFVTNTTKEQVNILSNYKMKYFFHSFSRYIFYEFQFTQNINYKKYFQYK